MRAMKVAIGHRRPQTAAIMAIVLGLAGCGHMSFYPGCHVVPGRCDPAPAIKPLVEPVTIERVGRSKDMGSDTSIRPGPRKIVCRNRAGSLAWARGSCPAGSELYWDPKAPPGSLKPGDSRLP
jgi:hypothetical protein